MEVTLEQLVIAANSIWVLVTGFLVFFMQLGFAMLEAGSVRVKNVGNIFLKNIVDFCIASWAFWAVGFALMFGAGNGFLGYSMFLMRGMGDSIAGLPPWVFWWFQLVFAGTAATIVSGAVAERIRFIGYLLYSFWVTALVYPIVGHWIWGGGFLAARGMLDFAGSTVVHSVGGWAGLVGTLVLGPRIGKYTRDGKLNPIPGHSMAIANIGMWVLWMGWFGFNPGSTLSIMDPGLVAKIAVNTNVAAALGVLTAMFISKIRTGKYDVPLSMSGCIGGLVAITAPCAFVSFVDSMIIGAIGGAVVVFGIIFQEKIHVDDPAGAIPCHLYAGIWGTLSVGLFHETKGLFYGGGFGQLGIQTLGILAVAVWTLATMFALFLGIKYTIGLRVSPEEELRGLDLTEHGAPAYPEFQSVSMAALDGVGSGLPGRTLAITPTVEESLKKGIGRMS